MRVLLIGFVLSLATLTACDRGGNSAGSGEEKAALGGADPIVEEQQSPPTEAHGPIWFEPAALEACGKPMALTVHWDAGSFPGVKVIDITVLKPDGTEALFLTAGWRGTKQTGAWMRAGSQMVLRNDADNAELGRRTVQSIPCDNQDAAAG